MTSDIPNVVLFFHFGDQESAACLLDLLLHVNDGTEVRYFLQYGDEPDTLRIQGMIDRFLSSRNARLVTDRLDIKPPPVLIDDDPNLADYPGPHTKRSREWKRRMFNWNICLYKYIHLLDHFQIIEPDCVILKHGWIEDIYDGFKGTELPTFGHLKTGIVGGIPMPTHWAGCSYYNAKIIRKMNLKRWFFDRYDNPWWPLRLETGSTTPGNCFWGPAFSGYDISYDYFLYALYWKEKTGSNNPYDWPAYLSMSREDLIFCDWRSNRSTKQIFDAHFDRLPLLHGVKADETRILARKRFKGECADSRGLR